MPSLRRQAWNLATSLAAFVSDGLKLVDADEYKRRLEICDGCDRRSGGRCSKCGCNLAIKARGRAFRCPLGKWIRKMNDWGPAGTRDHADEPAKPTLIVVLAIHRTLSSCLAVCIEKLGIWMGETATGGENATLANLCETALPFPYHGAPQVAACDVQSRLSDLINAGLANHTTIGLKYPTLCAFPDLLEQAVPEGVEVKWITLDRPIDESIQSLVDRSNRYGPKDTYYSTPEECDKLQRWLESRRREFLANREHLTIDTVDLLRHPGEQLDRLCEFIGHRPRYDQWAEAIIHVDPAKAIHSVLPPEPALKTEILVKSFLRPECLLRCLRSIKEHYPDVPIHVADDSLRDGEEYSWEFRRCQMVQGVEWHQLPFDTGLSAGRNHMVKHANAPYVLICDDDFVFTEETRIDKLAGVLDTRPDLISVSGVVHNSDGRIADWSADIYETADGVVVHGPPSQAWQDVAGTMICEVDLCWNFMLVRRNVLLEYPWDDELVIDREHFDWMFATKKAGLRKAYTRDVVVDQYRQNSAEYQEFRNRKLTPQLVDKWGFTKAPVYERKTQHYRRTPAQSLTIPKTIHQIWVGGRPMPDRFAKFRESWQSLHPDWEHKLWGDELEGMLPEPLGDLYRRSPTMAQRADMARLWIIWKYGGVYIDTDFEPLKPITPLLEDISAFVCEGEPVGHFCSGFLGAEPNHPFFEVLVDAYPRYWNPDRVADGGPMFVTAFVKGRDDVHRFPASVFMPVSWQEKARLESDVLFPGAHAVHHFAASWRE